MRSSTSWLVGALAIAIGSLLAFVHQQQTLASKKLQEAVTLIDTVSPVSNANAALPPKIEAVVTDFAPTAPQVAVVPVTPKEEPEGPKEEVLISYEPLPAEEIPINPKDQRCLGSLITTEAGNQSKLGKYGVGFTVPNRMALNRCDFGGNTVCGVVNYKSYDKRHGLRWQYDGMRYPPTQLTEATIEDMDIAADILRGRVKPQGWLKRALYYKYPKYAQGPGGKWFDKLVRLGQIGVHHYFDEDPNAEPPICHPQALVAARRTNVRVAAKVAKPASVSWFKPKPAAAPNKRYAAKH